MSCSHRDGIFVLTALVASLGLLACSKRDPDTAPVAADVAAGDPIEKVTEVGPVKATVRLRPAEPTVGDLMALELVVEARADVVIEMPGRNEALGRFAVTDYWDESQDLTGGKRYTQHYRIQAGASGRMRIPPLRVVFVDERSAAGSEPTGERELLTEELPIKVEPILPEDEAATAELRPARDRLEEDFGSGFFGRTWWIWAAGAGLAIALAVFLWRRRKRPQGIVISPFERASAALDRLEARGIPQGDAIDGYYVELSAIVRHYLEERFSLRAPELTTEEFLREAQKSVQLSAEHKSTLGAFLEDCDRVKFAAYQPKAGEIHAALEIARRFLVETHDTGRADEAAADASEGAAA